MTDRQAHSAAHAEAIAEAHAGRAEIVTNLSAVSADRIGEIDPRLLGKLSVEQRTELLLSIAGGTALPARAAVERMPAVTLPEPPAFPMAKSSGPLRRFVSVIPTPLQGLAGGLLVSVLIAGIVVGSINATTLLAPIFDGPMPRQISYWPSCNRLDRQTDACVYRVQRQITVAAAVEQLGIDRDYFLRTNQLTANAQSFGTGNRIIVWRGIRALSE